VRFWVTWRRMDGRAVRLRVTIDVGPRAIRLLWSAYMTDGASTASLCGRRYRFDLCHRSREFPRLKQSFEGPVSGAMECRPVDCIGHDQQADKGIGQPCRIVQFYITPPFRRALERLHPDLARTQEGISKIKMTAREIMAEIAEARIRYVSASED
jgi:hypothetical protein